MTRPELIACIAQLRAIGEVIKPSKRELTVVEMVMGGVTYHDAAVKDVLDALERATAGLCFMLGHATIEAEGTRDLDADYHEWLRRQDGGGK